MPLASSIRSIPRLRQTARAGALLAWLALALLLLPLPGQRSALADGEIVVGVAEPDDSAFPELRVVVTADRAGRPLTELSASQLRVTENGAPGVVSAVRRAQDSGTPLAVVVTLDTSGSMQGTSMEQAQAAASALLGRLAPDDAAAVVAFSDRVTVAQALTADRAATQRAVSGLVPSGNTALYDAVAESARVAAESGRPRRAVVMLSDGREFGGASRLTREESLESAARGGAVFYMVGVGPDIDGAYLEEIATRSGGRFFRAAGAGEVQQVYSALEELLRSQFIVTLRSSAAPAGVERSLAVEVRVGDGQGRTARMYKSERAGARATAPEPAPAPDPPTAVEDEPATRGQPFAWSLGGVELTQVAPAMALGVLAGGIALGGVGYYLGRVRPHRKSPVQLKTLRRGVDLEPRVARSPRVPVPEPSVAPAELVPRPPQGRSYGLGADDEVGHAPTLALLRVATGPSAGDSVGLTDAPALIGSAPDCTIQFAGGAGVAPHHARVVWRDGHALLEHLAAGFETRVNGRAVDWSPLDDGYEIAIGATLLVRYEVALADRAAGRRVA